MVQNGVKRSGMMHPFFFLLGLLMFGVGESRATDPPAHYFPLSVGNRWVYVLSEGSPSDPVTETWEVIRRKESGFVMRIQQSLLPKDSPAEFISALPDGIVMQPHNHQHNEQRNERRDGVAQRFILKTPLQLGTTWHTPDGRYEITALDGFAAVPADVFPNCLEVTFWSRNGQAKAVTLYAPGVGMVQRAESFAILGGVGGEDSPRQGHVSLWLMEWNVAAKPRGEK